MGYIRFSCAVIWLALILAMASPLYCAEIDSFRVEQAVVELPNIKVYAEMSGAKADADDNATGNIQIAASLGAVQTKTEGIRQFTQSGEGIGYVFLVDISKSLNHQQFEHMRQAISGIVGNMARKDMAAIITFGKDVKVVCDYTADRNELKSKINALKPIDDLTQLHRGLTRAAEMGRRKDATLPARKVIITLSDGEDDFAGGLTKDEVIDALKVDRVPIYAIGFYNPPSSPKKDEHLKTLGEFARRSGGELIRGNDLPYSEIYSVLNDRIRNSYIISLTCASCASDGQVYRLELTRGSISDGMDVRVLASRAKEAKPSPTPTAAPVVTPAAQASTSQMYLLAGVTILAALLVIILMRRLRHRHNRVPDGGHITAERLVVAQPKDDELHHAQRQKAAMLIFTVIGRARKTMSYEAPMDKPIVMGRNKAYCAITIADDIEISGVHCEISRSGGKCYIKDLGSTNGTMVNGISLTSVQRIDDGDIIMIGQTELRVNIPAAQQGDK
ncbi:MAG: VWA domain-containing protein [Candidatus Magnetominusculus sp. LBB02]|nr:VWA domain-containing protein [Candidatus Magnetominusculus sp. LBB02]